MDELPNHNPFMPIDKQTQAEDTMGPEEDEDVIDRDIIDDDTLIDMFGEGGKEEVEEHYKEESKNFYIDKKNRVGIK